MSWIAIPNRRTRRVERRTLQKRRWFRERWVGLGVIADNLIEIGTQLALQSA